MPAQTAENRNANSDGSRRPSVWRSMIERINWFHGEGNVGALRDVASDVVRRCQVYEKQSTQLRKIHEELKAKCDALTSAENYGVVITSVSNNGSRTVEVAGLGNGRVHVAVHPDVPSEQLRIGASALVARERNCLLRVTADSADWGDVAAFEDHLDSNGRILLRDRDSFIAVGMADQLKGTEFRKGDLVGFDRSVSRLAFHRLEPPDKGHLFDDAIDADFGELVGLDKTIALIRNVIDFRLLYPEVAAVYELPEQHGLILYGPAGNGKTHLARCVAGYLRTLFPDKHCRFMHVAASTDYNVWFGQSEQRIVERFEAAREAAQDGVAVIFFDEIDAIGRRRGSDHGSGAPDRVLNTLLTQLDGMVQNSNIVIIAATNRPDTLDEGLTRPGRFDWKVEVPAPNRKTSAAILRHYLQNRPVAHAADDVDQLVAPLLAPLFAPNGLYAEVGKVKLSDGRLLPIPGRELLSGAMLKNVVNVAARQAAVRETQTRVRGIREDDLTCALDDELHSVIDLLSAANVKSYVKSIPRDAQPIDVEAAPRQAAAQTYVRPEA